MIWKDKDGVLKYLFQEFIHFMIAKGTLKLKNTCIPFEKIQLNIKCGIHGPIYYYFEKVKATNGS
jgi:hypothetical protein